MGRRTILLAAAMLAPAGLLGTLSAPAADDQAPAKLISCNLLCRAGI
jgi:hypothetical protein